MSMSNSIRSKPLLVAITAALAAPAAAGQAESTPAGSSLIVEEILVTARKRSENLQELPLAVTAFSESDIENMGLRSLENLSQFSPGMKFSKQGTQRGGRSESVVRFRGMDTNDVTPARALASVFMDGIYISGGLSSISMDEVSRVEVIKGPQSAYFGRTTFGGAVNFVTRPIADELESRFSLTAAEDNEYDVTGSVEGGLVDGLLAGRVVGRYYTTDGRYTSSADGGRLGAEETKSLSVSFDLTPSDVLDVRLRAFYSEDDDGAPATFALGRAYHNCGPFPGGTITYICGKVPTVNDIGINTRLDARGREVYVDNIFNSRSLDAGPELDHLGLRRDIFRSSIAVDWQLPYENTTLSATGGYATLEQRRLLDLDGTSQQLWLESNFQDIEDSSLELRLTQERDRLRWMAGLSYFTLDFTTPSGASVGYLYPSASAPAGFFLDQPISTYEALTTAVFGSVSYDLTEQWNLSVEGRYQRDEVDQGNAAGVPLKETFTNFLPRVILQWTPGDYTNIYATYALGNKPGDFNAALLSLTAAQQAEVRASTGAQLTIDEEELESFELGLKQALFERRLQINAAAYYMKWQNQQTRTLAFITDPAVPSGTRSVPITVAAGETDLWGLELETEWRMTEIVTLNGSFNYAGSEFKDFICVFCARVVGTSDMAGNESPRYPKYSGSLGVDLFAPLTATMDWFARADLIYTGKAWDEAFNLAYNDEFWRTNVRAGLAGDRWRAELFVNNLFDDDTYQAAARQSDFSGGLVGTNRFVTNVTPAEPRQVGIRFSLKM